MGAGQDPPRRAWKNPVKAFGFCLEGTGEPREAQGRRGRWFERSLWRWGEEWIFFFFRLFEKAEAL